MKTYSRKGYTYQTNVNSGRTKLFPVERAQDTEQCPVCGCNLATTLPADVDGQRLDCFDCGFPLQRVVPIFKTTPTGYLFMVDYKQYRQKNDMQPLAE